MMSKSAANEPAFPLPRQSLVPPGHSAPPEPGVIENTWSAIEEALRPPAMSDSPATAVFQCSDCFEERPEGSKTCPECGSWNEAVRRAEQHVAVGTETFEYGGAAWPIAAERAFARWCAEQVLVEDYTAPHGQAFLAGWLEGVNWKVSRV